LRNSLFYIAYGAIRTRDLRIRGHSLELPNFLKLGKLFEIVRSGVVKFSAQVHLLAYLAKFFTHKFRILRHDPFCSSATNPVMSLC
jgi:hypothetical protein